MWPVTRAEHAQSACWVGQVERHAHLPDKRCVCWGEQIPMHATRTVGVPKRDERLPLQAIEAERDLILVLAADTDGEHEAVWYAEDGGEILPIFVGAPGGVTRRERVDGGAFRLVPFATRLAVAGESRWGDRQKHEDADECTANTDAVRHVGFPWIEQRKRKLVVASRPVMMRC